jgi:hypothetical protein
MPSSPSPALRSSRLPHFAQALFLIQALIVGAVITPQASAAPRMISYGYPNCIACHVSVQGRGLLKAHGRGIDIEQSLSDVDLTGELLGRLIDPKYANGDWNGYFGNVLADFVVTTRINHEFDTGKTDPTLSALYRQTIFFDHDKNVRLNTELAFRDSGLADVSLGLHQTAVGGDPFFLKKLALEWRFKGHDSDSGSELSIGRDYLPIGLQIDDNTAYILHLNRNDIYDYPLQAKYFMWGEKWLSSVYAFAPSFEEPADSQEYGGGFLYEYYPTKHLALGFQSVAAASDEADRWRNGVYSRWGISRKWTLLGEVDYSQFWNTRSGAEGGQTTAYLQLFYHHYEWLVSSLAGNYAHSELFTRHDDHVSMRYTLSARINRNFTVGVSFTAGDIRRNLTAGQEGSVFTSIKF